VSAQLFKKSKVTVSPSAVLAMKLHYIKRLPRHLQAIKQEFHATVRKPVIHGAADASRMT